MSEVYQCPVCEQYTLQETLQSQGLVITGMKALFDGDVDTVSQVFKSITPYDGHTAIGLCAALLQDLSRATGIPVEAWLGLYRQALNEEQANSDE